MTKAIVLGVVAVLALAFAGAGPAAAGAPASNVVLEGGRLTQGFGCVALELEPVAAWCPTGHYHSGVDLAAPPGTPIHALAAGEVTILNDPSGYGLHARVRHAGVYQTLYAHLSAALVHSGQRVAAGEAIGFLGSTGLSTGPHLHFEVRRDGIPIDPTPYLQGGTQPW